MRLSRLAPIGRGRVKSLAQRAMVASLAAASCAAWAASDRDSDDRPPVAPAAPVPAAPATAADVPQTQLGRVDVTGQATGGDQPPAPYAGGQVATGGRIGLLGEQDAANVPFSVVSFTSQLIENQQDDTVADVLLNDASVQTAYGFGNFAELFQIRGFTLNGEDISFGGLYGVLPRQIVQTNAVERVELFKGSNAFANGVSPTGSGVGGAVNLEPKRATDEAINRLRLGYASDSRLEQALDLGRRYGDNQQYGARLSVQHEKGDTAVGGENAANTSIGLGLDYRGDRARASFDFGYQKQHIKHGRNTVKVGTATKIPRAPDASTNYAPSFSTTKLENLYGMVRGEYDLTEHWTGYAAVGANSSDEQGQYGSPTLVGNDGSSTVTQLDVPFEAQAFTGQAGLRGDFDTGPVSHRFNLGYSGFYRRTSAAYTFSDLSNPTPTDIYNPPSVGDLPVALSGGNLDNPNVRSRSRVSGWAASDTAGFFDDRLLLTVGARYQALNIKNYAYDGTFDQQPISNHRVSPVYGLVYKPLAWLSLYANHIEALQPGGAAPTTAGNAGQVTGIVHAKQNEVGGKVDFGRIGGSIALYQIEKPDAYIDPATNIYGYFGEQRNRGVEVNIHGKPTQNLTLLASASWINPELRKTANGGANDGHDAIGVPDYRVVLGGDWNLPGAPRWTANARVIRTGSQYADAANRLKLDPWTRIDLGLRYKMPWGNADRSVTWRANVQNVADSDYWASAQGGYLSQGGPRTFNLSATFDF